MAKNHKERRAAFQGAAAIFVHRPVYLLTRKKLLLLSGSARSLRSPLLILSRAFCQFSTLEAPIGLKGGDALKAAMFQAESMAPQAGFDLAIIKNAKAYSVWYWNRREVENALAGHLDYKPACIVPESLAVEVEPGFHQIRLAEGCELQYRRSGRLVASRWLAEEALEADFVRFARHCIGATDAMPENTPPLVDVPYAIARLPHVPLLRQDDLWKKITGASLAGALICVLLGLYLAGAAIAGAYGYRADMREIRQIERQQRSVAAKQDGTFEALKQVNDRIYRLDPVFALAKALELAQQAGAEVSEYSATRTKARLILRKQETPAVQAFAELLEKDPLFANVTPVTKRNLLQTDLIVDLQPQNMDKTLFVAIKDALPAADGDAQDATQTDSPAVANGDLPKEAPNAENR